MSFGKMALVRSLVLVLIALICLPALQAQQAKKPFTVADDIGLTLFHNPNGDSMESVLFSPDNKYFAVYSQRGRLDVNLVEDSVSFYISVDVKNYLDRQVESHKPSPFWTVIRSHKESEDPSTGADRVIRLSRWLPDSSGLVFVAPTKTGVWQLALADIRSKKVEVLTPQTVSVRFFDVRDRQHYVYEASDAANEKVSEAPAKIATGQKIWDLFFPNDPLRAEIRTAYLWAVLGGKPFQVKKDGSPLAPEPGYPISLSPDGKSVVTVLNLPSVPAAWEQLYPPPAPSAQWRIRGGQGAKQFVRISLRTGSVQSLVDAPLSISGGDWPDTPDGAEWSSDGQSVLVAGTYLKSKENAPSRPCVAVVDLPSKTHTCVEGLKGMTEVGAEKGYHDIKEVQFVDGNKDRVLVTFLNHAEAIAGTTEYRRGNDGAWQVAVQHAGAPEDWHSGLEVTVKEDLNQRPVLVAANKNISRAIWDPNPQLKSFDLGEVSIYHWKDKAGRELQGNLYKPRNYQPGQRYPLVLQTHGNYEGKFKPSGVFTTAFAAQEMAAVGIMVLQVSDRCLEGGETPNEGPCAVSEYGSAVEQLATEGLVDPARVGIIGFSHSCFYVMHILTMQSSFQLKAASVNDGYMNDYLQFMWDPSPGKSEAWNGAAPFGEGLQLWLKRSPSFNLDKAHAPLLIMSGSGGQTASGLFMWGSYAGLYSLKKPVDLILLNTNEHGISNPTERRVSQGTNVDWFRFWLKDEEDPDPAKAEQYKRWRGLKQMQEENEKKSTETHSKPPSSLPNLQPN